MRVVEFPTVVATGPVDDRTLWVRFSDGVEGTVDVAELQGQPVVEIAPEHLYDRMIVAGSAPKRDYAGEFDDARREAWADCARMPEISRFFGIVIRMFWREHEAPHFHAQYAEFVASVEVTTGAVATQRFPARALRLVDEWRERHRDELLANWDRMRAGETPLPIPPLE